jgi:hypothetical protein
MIVMTRASNQIMIIVTKARIGTRKQTTAMNFSLGLFLCTLLLY